MKTIIMMAVAVGFAALTGCDNNTCRLSCTADTDCQAGQVCFGDPGRCAPSSCTSCSSTSVCEFNYTTCREQRCR